MKSVDFVMLSLGWLFLTLCLSCSDEKSAGPEKSLISSGKPFPDAFSKTGLFLDDSLITPVQGLRHYRVNAPLWSDGLSKTRYIYVPEGNAVGINKSGENFTFPVGTIFVKVFHGEKDRLLTLLEARVAVLRDDRKWKFGTWVWNQADSGKLLLKGHLEEERLDQTVRIPSEEACYQCHSKQKKRILGFSQRQISETSPKDRLLISSVLSTSSQKKPGLPKLESLDDQDHPLEVRVKSYLHSNCSSCHNPDSPDSRYDFRFTTPPEKMRLRGGRKLYTPGKAQGSLLVQVLSGKGPGAYRMPPGSLHPDEKLINIISNWINNLSQ